MTTECQRTAPERIYLNVFSETDEPFPYHSEDITWCDSEVGDNDPAYLRADLADAEIARLQAQVDALAGALQEADIGLEAAPDTVSRSIIRRQARAALAAAGR